MKKALFISTLQIFPAMSGGQMRSARLCEVLASSGFSVEIYSLTGRREDYLARRKSFQQILQSSLSESVNLNPLWAGLQFLSYKMNLPPLWAVVFLSFRIPKELRKKMQQADLIVLDFPFLLPLLKGYEAKTWLNTHNAEFELWERRPILAKLVRKIEERAFQRAAKVLFCSEQDLLKFASSNSELALKSWIIPNGVDTSKYHFSQEDKERARLALGIAPDKQVFLFVGSAYAPNIVAAHFLQRFAQEHGQLLREKQIVLVIAGSVLEVPERSEELLVLGRVDDVKQCLAACDFGLNPVTSGSGVNVKMIEFISSLKPTLSTPMGWRGLKLDDGQSGWTFTESTLLDVIGKAIDLSADERKTRAMKAFDLNAEVLDMDKSLKKLVHQTEMQVHL